jgi:REP element-mobilizing transposase RayT
MPTPLDRDDFGDMQLPALLARVETCKGHPAFSQADVAQRAMMELRRTLTRFRVQLLAYDVMPSHAHLLMTGREPGADPRAALRRWKQLSGRAHWMATGRTLWQPRCAEWLIADPARVLEAAAYLTGAPGVPPPPWWFERPSGGCRSARSSPR